MKLALSGDCLQRLGNNKFHIVADIGNGVHCTDVDTAVPSVAVVHNVPHPIRDFRGGIGHSRRHYSRIVSLYLIVNIIGVGIVAPMARHRRTYATQNIVTCSLIGVPQIVACMSKSRGKRVGGRVEPQTVEHPHKGKIHINIVVERGHTLHIFSNVVGLAPRNLAAIGNHARTVLKLCGAAVGATEHLSRPCAFYLVHESSAAHCHARGEFASRRECKHAHKGNGKRCHNSFT